MTPEYPDRKNVLVIQLGDVGDVVLATAAFRAVREAYPDCRLSVLVRKGCGSLLGADPALSEVIESARGGSKAAQFGIRSLRLVRRLRAARYDLVVDLRTGDRGAILAFLTGAPDRVSYFGSDKSFWRNRIFTRLVRDPKAAPPPVHPGADQSLRLLRAVGIDTADSTPRLFVPEEADARVRGLLAEAGVPGGSRWVTINPFSRWRYKEWVPARWAEVIRWLADDHGFRSVLVGTREEADRAGEIAARSGGRAASLAGRTTLGELAALLRRSSLHIGVDSAAPHIACAVGAPTVTIFGPSDWRAWTVPDETHRIVAPDEPCVPCHRKGCDGSGTSRCLEEMGAGKVIAAVREVLPGLPR